MYILQIPRVSDNVLKHFCLITYVSFNFIKCFCLRDLAPRGLLSSILCPLTSGPGDSLVFFWVATCFLFLDLFLQGFLRGSVEADHFELASLKASYFTFTLSLWFDLSRTLG